LGVSEARVETVDSVVRLVCRDARATESRLGCSVIPIREIKPNFITKGGRYTLRDESSRPIVCGVTPNCDGDDLSSHHPGIGENEKYRETHHGVNGKSTKVRRFLGKQSAENKSNRGKQVEEGAEFWAGATYGTCVPQCIHHIEKAPSQNTHDSFGDVCWDNAANEHA